MAKKFYCSVCGVELIHSRKAVPNRGVILDLIEPHRCEGYAIKTNKSGRPTVKNLLDEMKPLGTMEKVTEKKEPKSNFFNFKDNRDGVRSSAPNSLIEHVKSETE